jgi:hypothetical protein
MAKMFDSAKKVVSSIADVGGDFGGWLNIAENIFGLMGRKSARPAGAGQEAGLKAGFMGIGREDEALFWDAVAQAFQGERNVKQKSKNIRKIFGRLDHSQKKRLFQTIGINEQEIIETEPKSVEYTDQKGVIRQKIERKEKRCKVNERGKRFIQFLARLDVNEAVMFLKMSGTLTGPLDDLQHFWSVAQPFLDSITDVNIKKRVRKSILWYLGATTLRDAETRVTAKELALEMRQQQPWYDRRDLHNRNVMLVIWTALAVFSIAGLTYVFAFAH